MISLIIGVSAIGLGIKAFTKDGLPLTKKKNLTGKTAKVIGIICILIGLPFLIQGAVQLLVLLVAILK